MVEAIMAGWPAEGQWNAVHAAKIMLLQGAIPQPQGLTLDQIEIFAKTHLLMVAAAGEVRKAVAGAELDPEIWKLLLRGGVCERLVSAPGETGAIKVINAMRGERKAWPARRTERLWEQLSYPAGIADATLVLLGRLERPELEPYREALLAAIPRLRRCRKLTQERRR